MPRPKLVFAMLFTLADGSSGEATPYQPSFLHLHLQYVYEGSIPTTKQPYYRIRNNKERKET